MFAKMFANLIFSNFYLLKNYWKLLINKEINFTIPINFYYLRPQSPLYIKKTVRIKSTVFLIGRIGFNLLVNSFKKDDTAFFTDIIKNTVIFGKSKF